MIISEMQIKLAKWSSGNKERKFDRLLRLIANKEWLRKAAEITLKSSGSNTPGIDGISKVEILDNLTMYIDELHKELIEGVYEPRPAKRVYIPKANGKNRPLGILCLRDRIVQRAMLMAMEPIWESDFHSDSFGFRPKRSVHHAIGNVVINLHDTGGNPPRSKGRWVIEGDLSSYFDKVHHKLLMTCIRKRISDKRLITLLWKILKAGIIENNSIHKPQEGVPQGAVLSPLLSNILLNEFDQYMDRKYLCKKARDKRNGWNASIRNQTAIALREKREWQPAISYTRFADDFVIIVKGSRSQAENIREEVKDFLVNLNLTLNMEKTYLTHVNDGFVFLGHRVIRKRGGRGKMRVVTQIPQEKVRGFSQKITKLLSSNHSINKVEMIRKLNYLVTGWTNFYRCTTYTAVMFQKLDTIIFWKLGHWLARKYKTRVNKIMRKMYKRDTRYNIKTWIAHNVNNGKIDREALVKCIGTEKVRKVSGKPRSNPYLEISYKGITPLIRNRDIAFISNT